MMKHPLCLLLATALLLPLSAQELGEARQGFFEMAKRYEVKLQDPAPAWALRRDRPLFQLAWLSDTHVENATIRDELQGILRQILAEIRPVAILFTGDNWGWGKTPLQRQRAFQNFLQQTLGDQIPAVVLPGDNWPQDFHQVFGPSKFAFTLGGVRFVAAAADVSGKSNGCSLHDPETLQWLQKELESAGNRPVIYLQHEPVEPPSTLDAPKISALLDAAPQVFLALGGHFHLNLEFVHGHWRQWVAPSTGRSHRPAFKVLSFYSDCVIAQDWEQTPEGPYKPVSKFLRAEVPEGCREGLHSVATFGQKDFSALPPAPHRNDPSLDAQAPELTRTLMQFALRYALRHGRASTP
ncbi:MAG: metallophosphoesterase family protein [Oligosphaeraceae bacterium]